MVGPFDLWGGGWKNYWLVQEFFFSLASGTGNFFRAVHAFFYSHSCCMAFFKGFATVAHKGHYIKKGQLHIKHCKKKLLQIKKKWATVFYLLGLRILRHKISWFWNKNKILICCFYSELFFLRLNSSSLQEILFSNLPLPPPLKDQMVHPLLRLFMTWLLSFQVIL